MNNAAIASALAMMQTASNAVNLIDLMVLFGSWIYWLTSNLLRFASAQLALTRLF
jgi:hypothetical protein